MRNALSVDVEDWFQVGAFETVIKRSDWDSLECRAERNTDGVLALFDDAGVKATFFTLGWVAERYPALMRRIVEAGHEIASHGYAHDRVFNFTPDQFAADIDKARKIIEDTSGAAVTGYRAPSFSIDKRTPWAHEILAEKGYYYSSSVAPVKHDHYGWAEAPRFAFHPVAGSDFLEIPVTTAQLGPKRLAAGGGGFFRLLPYQFSRWAIRQVNLEEGRPAIIYFHPWEIDPDQPRVANAPVKSKLRHYTKLDKMAGKLARLAREFEWERLDAIAMREQQRLLEKAAA
ncbi:XrtA system polysaccharide deacetylase [Sphingorhabdus arenilitoris]|uniref:Chitooligosaccharide deacetylase n=1 Tax=Sphingorhabdus arenilitoris TaxID=1490041 RepID=A0ABV8RHF3_9SPHN